LNNLIIQVPSENLAIVHCSLISFFSNFLASQA